MLVMPWAVVWLCIGSVVGAYPTQCDRRGSTLFCDYKNSAQTIHIEELDGTLQKVVVSNGQRLDLSESACVDVTVNNVVNMVVVMGQGYPCHTAHQLSVTNSSLDRLPNQVSRVYLEDTHINHLVTNAKTTELVIINSTINVLNISRTLPEGINATFLLTSIGTLQELQIINGSNLLLQKTHIDIVPVRGLVIQEANVVVKESTTNTTSAEGVVMGPGATINLENYTGNLGVKTTSNVCPIYASGQGMVAHESTAVLSNICKPSLSYFSAYVTCLVFLLIEFIFIILGISYLTMRQKSNTERQCSNNNSNGVQDKIIEPKVTSDDFTWKSQDDIEEPLLQKLIMDGSQQYLQRIGELTEEICTSMQKQKSLLKAELKDTETKCKAKLDKIQDRRDKTLQLEETLINNEFQELEARYEREERKVKRNWDAVIHVLKQIRDIKEIKEKIYIAKINDEVQQVEHKAKLEVANKGFLRQLCHIGQTLLVKWTVSSDSSEKTHPHLATIEDLFKYILHLLIKEFNTKIHETEARDELQKYINNEEIKKIQKVYEKRLKDLDTSYRREHADLNSIWKSEKSSDNVRKNIQEFYDTKTQLLTISQKLDLKVLLYEYSENKPKLHYLNNITNLQKKDINDVENILSLSTYVLQFYFKLMKEVVQSPSGEHATDSEAVKQSETKSME